MLTISRLVFSTFLPQKMELGIRFKIKFGLDPILRSSWKLFTDSRIISTTLSLICLTPTYTMDAAYNEFSYNEQVPLHQNH